MRRFLVNKRSCFFAGWLVVFFVASSIIYLHIPTLRELYPVSGSVCLLGFTVYLASALLLHMKVPVFTHTEVLFLLFLAYKIIYAFALPVVPVQSIALLVFYFLLYWVLRIWVAAYGSRLLAGCFAGSIALLFIVYLVAWLWPGGGSQRRLLYFLPNTSVFAILLAAQLSLLAGILCGYYQQPGKKWPVWLRILIMSGFAAMLLLLLWTNGRAGWVGLGLAISLVLYSRHRGLRKRKWLFTGLFCLLLAAIAFLYKPGSSAGRLLIYKVSVSMLKDDNWLWGVGEGQFKVQYNQYQSRYFSTHNINSREAMLAANTIYAFNEPMQVLIENGIIGLLLLGALVFFLVLQIKKIITVASDPVAVAAAAMLGCLGISALVFYPFHVMPIVIIAIVCLALLPNEIPTYYQGRQFKTGTKCGMTLLAMFLVVYFIAEIQFYNQVDKAAILARAGFKNKALAVYKSLSEGYIKEGHTLFLYGQELYYANRLPEAESILIKAGKYYSSNELYALLGTVYAEQGLPKKAGIAYKKAVTMVPQKMKSRFNLLQFYIGQKDTANVRYWGESILAMPVKVPSAAADNMRRQVRLLLAHKEADNQLQ